MQFQSESFIAHPRAVVFAAYRDRLSEIAAYLDDIEEIVVLDRKDEDGTVRLHNEWAAKGDKIPSVARSIIKPEQLRWDDHAVWNEASWSVSFEIRIRAFPGAVQCTGTNTFTETDGGTKVTLNGDFVIDGRKVPGIPFLLRKTLVPQVEKFIVAMIQPNLAATNDAVGDFLDAQD